jgi:hypothetical protein
MKVTAVAFTFAALASATLAVPVLSSEQNQGTYLLLVSNHDPFDDINDNSFAGNVIIQSWGGGVV